MDSTELGGAVSRQTSKGGGNQKHRPSCSAGDGRGRGTSLGSSVLTPELHNA